MVHLVFFVEEPSAEIVLAALVPKIIGERGTLDIFKFNGKPALRRKLGERLRAYASWLPSDWRIVVLIDQDQQDCRQLKAELEQKAADAGLRTYRNVAHNGAFQVLTRIAIEELEAWYFGDPDAMRQAFPHLPDSFERRAAFRNPDSIAGGASEAIEQLLRAHGYFTGGLDKRDLAQRMSVTMHPDRNTSPSFRRFRDGLLACLEQEFTE